MTIPARSPVDDALAVLRRGCYLGGELPTVEEVEAALATVREELQRLREERTRANHRLARLDSDVRRLGVARAQARNGGGAK